MGDGMRLRDWLKKLLRYTAFFPPDALAACLYWCGLGLMRLRAPQGDVSPEAVMRWLGAVLCRRRLSDEDVEALVELQARSGLSPARFVFGFFMWPACVEARVLGASSLVAHHQAREELVRRHLPPARRILDLGGSSGGIAEGGLLHMGYPHAPDEVYIVDLPPGQQFGRHAGRADDRPHRTPNGTLVHTRFTSMDDLSCFLDASFDGVWSGQSIEHVTAEQARRMLREVRRVLRPDGWLCLDTPNARLAKLLCRRGLLHPEHKMEYRPHQLRAVLGEEGFRVVKMLAVSEMPLSARLGRFCKLELIHGTKITDDADLGFSFFLRAHVAR